MADPKQRERLKASLPSLIQLADSMLEDNKEPDPNALIPQGDGVYVYKRFVMTPVGMQMPDDVTDEELIEVGVILENLETSIQWNIGDWFSRSDRVWGRMYMPAPEAEGYDQAAKKYQTLADYAWIARKVDFSIRNRKLSFSHHRNVAPLDRHPELQWWWLAYAVKYNLTVSVMKVEMASVNHLSPEEQIETLKMHISQESRLPKKSPALSGHDEDTVSKVKGNARVIAKYWDSLGQLSGKRREEAIEAGLEQRRLVNEYLRRLGVG